MTGDDALIRSYRYTMWKQYRNEWFKRMSGKKSTNGKNRKIERKKEELNSGNIKTLRVSCSAVAASVTATDGASVECCLLTDKEFQFINIS